MKVVIQVVTILVVFTAGYWVGRANHRPQPLRAAVVKVAAAAGNSRLWGWRVVDSRGEGTRVVCNDPYVWPGIKEIACDLDD